MKFLVIVKRPNGPFTHEFVCPLERKRFVDQLLKDEPGVRFKLRNRKEIEEACPAGEEKWYGGAR